MFIQFKHNTKQCEANANEWNGIEWDGIRSNSINLITVLIQNSIANSSQNI